MIPVWGSGRAAINDFQNRRWGWGLFNTALAISDLFMVGAAFKAGSKLLVKGAGKLLGTEGGQAAIRIFRAKSSEIAKTLGNPATVKQLREILGKTGLLDSKKFASWRHWLRKSRRGSAQFTVGFSGLGEKDCSRIQQEG